MKRVKISENQVLAILGVLAAVSGLACLIMSAIQAPVRAWNFEETVEAVSAALPEPLPSERFVPYVWKFEDVYEARNGRLRLRGAPASRVETAFDVTWLEGAGSHVQVSDNAEFTGRRVHAITAPAGFLTLRSVYLGENFWRVSADGTRWSKSYQFVVEPEFSEAEVRLRVDGGELFLSADAPMKRFVLEFSRTKEFAPASTFVFSTADSRLPWNPHQSGFLRARGVKESGELTAYSAAVMNGSL